MNSCIFCLESGDIVHNVKCRCNFCFHLACYEKYNRKTVCPMCRANVGELYVPPSISVDTQEPVSIIVQPPIIQNSRSKTVATIICLLLCIAISIVILRVFFAN